MTTRFDWADALYSLPKESRDLLLCFNIVVKVYFQRRWHCWMMLALGLWLNRKAENFPVSFCVLEKRHLLNHNMYFNLLKETSLEVKQFFRFLLIIPRLSERLQIPVAPSDYDREVRCGAYKRTPKESSSRHKALNAAQPTRGPHITAPVALAVTAHDFWETALVSGCRSLLPSWLRCVSCRRLDVLLAGRSAFHQALRYGWACAGCWQQWGLWKPSR